MGTPSQYDHFTVEELSCHCGNCDWGPEKMDPWFMERLVRVRKFLGFPIPVNSSIRCPAHNRAVSETGEDGPHTTGKTIDAALYGKRALAFIAACIKFGLVNPGYGDDQGYGGIGIAQTNKDKKKRFVHVDALTAAEYKGPRPWIWTY